MIDKAIAIKMYNEGTSLAKIGKVFGVSRQRIWQALKPSYKELVSHPPRYVLSYSIRPEESWVVKKLKTLGMVAQFQGCTAPYDILANGKKIEVKYRSRPQRHMKSGDYYEFSPLVSRSDIDYWILIFGDIKNPNAYIIPGKDNPKSIYIPVTPKFNTSSRRKYLNKWSLLTQFDINDPS